MILTFHGADARLIGRTSNRLCEVIRDGENEWRPGRSMAEVARLPAECVRLRADARILIEDITRTGLDPSSSHDTLRATIAERLTLNGDPDARQSLELIRTALEKEELL